MLDIHEGAEFPLVGAVAAVAGFFSTVATNTSNYSERLKHRSTAEVQTRTAEDVLRVDVENSRDEEKILNPVQLEKLAIRMAYKTYEGSLQDDLNKTPALRGVGKYCTYIASKRAERGRAHEVSSATAHYAADLTRTAMTSK
jgi:sterol 3beta-glucosyltransferase